LKATILGLFFTFFVFWPHQGDCYSKFCEIRHSVPDEPILPKIQGSKYFYFLDSTTPLSKFSKEWSHPKYVGCNTAKYSSFLTQKEKQVIFILNLARTNPLHFLNSVVKRYPEISGKPNMVNSSYYKSLLVFLQTQSQLPILQPENILFESARCHAINSGKIGYEGHDRQSENCKKVEKFLGECCFYGADDPFKIVMELMIDEDVPSLGHREIFFTPYTQIGVSIQPHVRYRWNSVLDFG